MNRKQRNRSKVLLLRELEQNPLIERACNKVGVARSTYYRWCESDPDFSEQADKAQTKGRAKFNDFAEAKLIESINSGYLPAIKLWLSHNHSVYKSPNSGDWLYAVEALQEFDRIFNYAIGQLGPQEARRIFGFTETGEVKRTAARKAVEKQRKRRSR